MVRFRFGHDPDDDDHPSHETSIVRANEYAREHERANYALNANFRNSTVRNDEDEDDRDAQPYVVAYQRDGTPILVPFPLHHAPPSPLGKQKRMSWSFIIIMIAILMQVIRWYGPPAPPSADETWPEFLGRETGALVQSLAALLSVIPHVTHWCYQSVHADIVDMFQPPPVPCVVDFTKTNDDKDFSSLRRLLQDSMIGQPRAVTVALQALEAWSRNDENKALVLILSGTIGLGKLRLAQLVVAASGCHVDMILQLHGRDIRSTTDTSSLAHRIRQHTLAANGGGSKIVILEHPEEMPPLLLKEALQSLPSHMILIMTTHAGSRVIHRHLKQSVSATARGSVSSSSSSLLSSSFDWDLRHEIEEQLHVSLSDHRDTMTSVAPFVPMGVKELKEILLLQVRELGNNNGQSLEMTDELAEAWTTADHIEYLKWKSQGHTILTFSSQGAKVMDNEIRPRLVAQLHQCLQDEQQQRKKTMVQLDWDDEDEEAVVLQCVEEEHQDEDDDEEELQCEEMCRFSLRAQ